MLNDNIGYIRVTGFNTTSDNGEKSTFSEFKDKITGTSVKRYEQNDY